MANDKIIIKGAREHNLKNINLTLPREKLIVMTGLSGSGKSSLAFDTIYADGQRRYVESLSSYARMFLGQMDKPDVDYIEGLSPAISIDQKTTSHNPRSTVGTVTEIYDYLRLLWARAGTPHCPNCGKEIRQQTIDQIIDQVLALPEGTRIQVMAPVIRGKKGEHAKVFEDAKRSGYVRARVDGSLYELDEEIKLEKNKKHSIEIIVDRLLREFKVEANVGQPQVSYRETIRKRVEAEGKYVRQSGGKGQYGHCKIILEPTEPGTGYVFEDQTVGGCIPKEYIQPINMGIQAAAKTGVLAGYEVVDFKVTVVDGSYHEVDSSEMAYKVAGSMAFKEGCQKANPVLLEPMMKVEVTVPDDYLGDVMGNISSRRGNLTGIDMRNGIQAIHAFIPLSEMFGYATDLRSRTQGRGNFTMQFDHYDEIPKNIAEKIIGKK